MNHRADLGLLHARIESTGRCGFRQSGGNCEDPELRAMLEDGLLIHAPLVC